MSWAKNQAAPTGVLASLMPDVAAASEPVVSSNRPSLLEVQREEEASARARKRAQAEERKRNGGNSNVGRMSSGGVWSGSAGSDKPKSLAEIQEEERIRAERQARAQQMAGGGAAKPTGWAQRVAPNAGGAHQPPAMQQQQQQRAAGGQVNDDDDDDEGLFFSGASTSKPTASRGDQSSFQRWAAEQIRGITGREDVTLVHFLMSLKDEGEVRQYIADYVGDTAGIRKFATEFLNRMPPPSSPAIPFAGAGRGRGGKKR
jgi:hypothetical protein